MVRSITSDQCLVFLYPKSDRLGVVILTFRSSGHMWLVLHHSRYLILCSIWNCLTLRCVSLFVVSCRVSSVAMGVPKYLILSLMSCPLSHNVGQVSVFGMSLLAITKRFSLSELL